MRYGGYTGLELPVILGVERQLAPGWSATLNGFRSGSFGNRYGLSSTD